MAKRIFVSKGKVDHTPDFNIGSRSHSGGNVDLGKYCKSDNEWAGGMAKAAKAQGMYTKDFRIDSSDGFDAKGINPNQPMKSRGNA